MNKYFSISFPCFLFLCLLGSNVCLAQVDDLSPRRQAINAALDAFENNSVDPVQVPQETVNQEVLEAPVESPKEEAVEVPAEAVKEEVAETPAQAAKEEAIEAPVEAAPKEPAKKEVYPQVKTTGQVRASVGIDSDGQAYFTRANANLNEKDYRLLDAIALDNKTNSYDPQIYSRLKTVTDVVLNKYVDLHLNLTIDPWSFVGKTQKVTVAGANGDAAEFQYLVWGNTGYAINQTFNSLMLGDVIQMREVKVRGGSMIPATSFATGSDSITNTYNVPALKVEYSFMPIREAWVDLKPENDTLIRIFPMAYGDQALTSDDPLKLSNNSQYWAESPWLWSWQKGNYNTGVTPAPNYSQGKWDRGLAFAVRDSDYQRLTALRGASIKIKPDEDNSFEATIASPKTLWQEYSEVNAIPGSMRAKHFFSDQAYVGAISNMHLGFNEGSQDAANYTGGIDGGFVPVSGVLLNGQYSSSVSRYDQTAPDTFPSKKEGNAYYVSMSTSSNPEEMIRKDYFTLAPIQKNDNFYKSRLYYARMDKDFESTLSNYHDTREDSYWSRHMTFYPNTYRNMPGVNPGTSEEDLESFAYGNGIDYGRYVVGGRADTHLMQGRLKGLFDFRRVMNNENDQHIETVARTQWSLQATDKLVTKGLLMLHELPNTVKDVDPFVYDHSTGEQLVHYGIAGDKDPSLKTGSLGARYELTNWANVNGVWEYTNDFTLGSNNIPSGLEQNVNYFTTTDGLYRKVVTQVFGPFQKPPYDYHNIFKMGLELIPREEWHIYLDYTRNPNRFAGNIDDNMNHFGIETSFTPNKKLGFFARYTYSKWYDLAQVYENQALDYRAYNNFYFETRLLLPADALLSLQYGVGPSYNLQSSSVNPNLSYYANPTLETQHLFRLVYDKKF